MLLKIGTRLYSAVSDAAVIVVNAPSHDVEITCGDVPMELEPVADKVDCPSIGAGVVMGKRYAAAKLGVELLGTQAGGGALAVNGTPLMMREAKPLPASD